MDIKEQTINTQNIYSGKILSLRVDEVSLPNGVIGTREVIEHNGGVIIIPITDNGHFVMVEQYRYATQETLLEFPAGRLNAKTENIFEAAKRELEEETGYICQDIKLLLSAYSAPGFCNEKMHFFFADNLLIGTPSPDEDEFVNTILVTEEELKFKISKQEIKDCKTLIGFMLYQNLNLFNKV